MFSEPYDCMPNFYFNNHFEKGDCNCVSNKEQKDCNNHNYQHDCDCHKNSQCNNKSNFGFDIKNLMPILSSFNKGGVGGLDLNSISSLLNSAGGFDFSKLLSNPDLIKNVLSMFGGVKRTIKHKEDVVCTDYEIKNYTKVK